MLTIAAFVLAQNSLEAWQANASASYAGIPQFAGQSLVVVSHTVTLAIAKDHVDVSSTTLIKNNGPAGSVNISVPVGSLGGAPTSVNFAATWATAAIALTPDQTPNPKMYTATVPVQNLGSYALRLQYAEPLGGTGMDRHKRLVVYGLHSSAPIGTLMVTYRYSPNVVFNLPDVGPGSGWQVGRRGAFLRRQNYGGQLRRSFCAFYPGGFD